MVLFVSGDVFDVSADVLKQKAKQTRSGRSSKNLPSELPLGPGIA